MNRLEECTGTLTSHVDHTCVDMTDSSERIEASALERDDESSEEFDSQMNEAIFQATDNSCSEGKKVPAQEESDAQFDLLVGILESMLLDEKFVTMVNDFGSKYCMEFDDRGCSENGCPDVMNKLIYTERFVQYNEMIERFMENYVIERMREEGFHTITFPEIENMVSNRLEEITGDVADVLLSFSDFEEFRQMMFSYKEQMSVKNNLSSLMTVNHLEQSWHK